MKLEKKNKIISEMKSKIQGAQEWRHKPESILRNIMDENEKSKKSKIR